jgi:hypothetical protein
VEAQTVIAVYVALAAVVAGTFFARRDVTA